MSSHLITLMTMLLMLVIKVGPWHSSTSMLSDQPHFDLDALPLHSNSRLRLTAAHPDSGSAGGLFFFASVAKCFPIEETIGNCWFLILQRGSIWSGPAATI